MGGRRGGPRAQPHVLVLQREQAERGDRLLDTGRARRPRSSLPERRPVHHDAPPGRTARTRDRLRRTPGQHPSSCRRLDHALRPRRAVVRPRQLRPCRLGPREPAQQLWLRRPHDPAHPPRGGPGLPVSCQLCPDGPHARARRASGDGSRPVDRCRHARLSRGECRTVEPVLVLSEGARPSADVPPCAAHPDAAGALPVR